MRHPEEDVATAVGLSPASGTSGPGIFGKLENLADDQVSGVVNDVAIQVQNFAGPARLSQGIAGDRSERVVLADLVDRPSHRVAGSDLRLSVPIGLAAFS